MGSLLLDSADVTRWFMASKGDVRVMAAVAVRELEGRAGTGDQKAEVQLREWVIGGARQELKGRFNALNQVAVANGHRLTLPQYMSFKQNDGSRQLRAWQFASRDDFEQMVAGYRAQTERRVQVLEVFDQIRGAWDQHPELATAREVCAIAGIELAEIEAVA